MVYYLMNDYQVIIIIGLPGSGKTTYSDTNEELKDCIIFDDFIRYFWKGYVMKSIKNNDKVCLIDPRLCMFDVFKRYISKIEKYVSRDKIKLVIFDNNPDQCLLNIKDRDNRKGIDRTILEYSKVYNIDHYKDWICHTIPVFMTN